jgi:hypothetical protein
MAPKAYAMRSIVLLIFSIQLIASSCGMLPPSCHTLFPAVPLANCHSAVKNFNMVVPLLPLTRFVQAEDGIRAY